MNLKAIILPGQTEITVNGLHQWDYGRALEIQSADLPALLEVHFACPGMKEAVVRSCSGASGVATAAIPDVCLEQTAPITAWVYEVGETTGATIITITLPIIARTRPQTGATIPTATSDKYTEAVAAMNEAVASVTAGGVKVNAAKSADKATLADNLSVQALASGTDLNSVTGPGRYSLAADDTYKNAIMTNTVRYLDVVKVGNYIWQIITGSAYQGSDWHPFRTYKRCYSINSVAGESTTYGWTSWYEEINKHNLGLQSITATSIKPSRYGAVTVTDAEVTMQSALQNNKIYLVQIKGSYATGKLWVDSGIFMHTDTSASHFVTVGDHLVEISNTSISVMKLDGTLTDVTPLTVTFYEMGAI